MLVEPCSQLMWRRVFEPKVITNQGMPMASIQLVDQGTLEMLVAVMYDQIQNAYEDDHQACFDEVKDPENDHLLSINFAEVKINKSQSKFVDEFIALEHEIKVSIFKDRESLNIKLSKPGEDELDINDSIQGSTYNNNGGQYILLMRIDPQGGDQHMAKVIKTTGLSFVLITVQVHENITTVKIVKLEPERMDVLFKFTLEDLKENQDDSDQDLINNIKSGKQVIFTSTDIHRALNDSMRRYYTSSVME